MEVIIRWEWWLVIFVCTAAGFESTHLISSHPSTAKRKKRKQVLLSTHWTSCSSSELTQRLAPPRTHLWSMLVGGDGGATFRTWKWLSLDDDKMASHNNQPDIDEELRW
jgi:hypothetical protein